MQSSIRRQHKMSKDTKTISVTTDSKKQYNTPALTALGPIQSLVLSGGTGGPDGGNVGDNAS